VAKRVKAPFLRRPCDHNRVILVQLSPLSHTLLRQGTLRWLSQHGGFEQAANSVVRNQRNNRKTRKWTTLKRMRIRPKYSATVAFLWQEDKDGTKQNKLALNRDRKELPGGFPPQLHLSFYVTVLDRVQVYWLYYTTRELMKWLL